MEKNLKRIKTLAVLLIIVLISAIAFVGLYLKSQGVWRNVLPEFSYGMELDGIRELRFVLNTSEEEKKVYIDENGNYCGDVVEKENEVSSNQEISLVDENGNPISSENGENKPQTTEETSENKELQPEDDMLSSYKVETRTIKSNEDADINIDNFEKSKKIIQERLETLDLYEYNIRLDDVTGELVVEVPDNDNVEIQESMIATKGKFEVVDHQNGLILLDNTHVKKVTATYANNESGYQSYLIVQLNKQGTEKLKEISKKYVATTDENGNETTKYIAVEFDDQELLQTYFGNELTNGVLQIPLGQATSEYEDFVTAYNSTTRVASILNSEKMPLSYKLNSDNYIQSDITTEARATAIISFVAILLILCILMVIKYKLNGLKYAIFNMGYIAIVTLIFRYTNVLITLNSLIALIGVIGINILFEYKLLENLKKNDNIKLVFAETMKKLYLAIIPVAIIAITFTFMSSAVISSIGMVLFWGIAIQALYSSILYLIGII